MAKLHLFYSVMNAGKTTHLLQAHWNYTYNGGEPLLFTSSVDDRNGVGVVSSRIGLQAKAIALKPEDNLYSLVSGLIRNRTSVPAVLIDEAQFLTAEQAIQASDLVDFLQIPVMAYGLKNNVFGQLFSPGMEQFLALADQINEIKQLCHCGRKATMILRYGPDGKIDRSGDVVEIGDENRYVSVCRYHHKIGDIGEAARRLVLASGNAMKVYCCSCDKGFKEFNHRMADGCSAEVRGSTVEGNYGSAAIDMQTWAFIPEKPANVGNGLLCDACIEHFITEEKLELIRGEENP